MDDIGIVSKKDKIDCLEKVAEKYGATLESLDRKYFIDIKVKHFGTRETFIAPNLYIWISRSVSLRELTETSYEGFKRFSKYMVLYNPEKENCYLLYNTEVCLLYDDDHRGWNQKLEIRSELSIKIDDIFEAMRLINADEIHDAFIEEYEKLLDKADIIK